MVTPWTESKLKATPTTNDDLIIGIELEIENLPKGLGRYQEMAYPFWHVEEDGSLRPRGEAWEFISTPAKMGTTLAEMETLFKTLGVSDRNYSDRTSVHIHTNVQDFTQKELSTLFLIYPVFEEVLFQFINHFKAPEEQGYCRDTNLYCIPWSACRMNNKAIEKVFQAQSTFRHWQKYTALNILPVTDKGTVEWRHMHGTCNMEKLTIWANLIGAIMRYCKSANLDDVVQRIKTLNDVSTYQQFFEEVLRHVLPYDEKYRRLMAEGVVNAKLALINWDGSKEVKKGKPKTLDNYAGLGLMPPGPPDEDDMPPDDWFERERTAPIATEVREGTATIRANTGTWGWGTTSVDWNTGAPTSTAEMLRTFAQERQEIRDRELANIANNLAQAQAAMPQVRPAPTRPEQPPFPNNARVGTTRPVTTGNRGRR